jgi:hypothetical protein
MASTLFLAHQEAEPAFEQDPEACGEGAGGGLVGYAGAVRVCADELAGSLRDTEALLDGEVHEIVLLTSRPNARTTYRVDAERRPILALANLVRRTGQPLAVRGQLGPDRRPLVWFRGLDLVDTLCDPARVLDEAACREGRPQGRHDATVEPWEQRYELTSLALVEEAEIARALREPERLLAKITEHGPHSHCVRLRHVAGIILSDLGFEDCWLSAALVVNSRDVTLERSVIHGSTFGMLVVATSGMEADVHTFRLRETHWLQSPAAYRADRSACAAPERDLSCAVDVWDQLPWGITHHHIWRPLNGALFGAYNVAGNVLFENNVVERAYNGFRMISERPGTGRNIEIRGNRFRLVRDNAVEPEGRGDGWVIKHNAFENVHAWISTEGVEGGSMFIFGNVARLDPELMPGVGCSDEVHWASSPRFTGLAGGEGRYLLIDTSYDPSSVECRGHQRGVVIKTGDDRKAGFPYFRRISIFNNTWETRSPLFSGKHASPLSHFNNLVAFRGCGLDGPWHCRQIPAPIEYCSPGNERTRGRAGLDQLWTEDGGALVADCFSFMPGPAVPDERAKEVRDVAHVFCRDAFNRAFPATMYGEGECAPVFDTDIALDAAASGIEGCAARVTSDGAYPDCTAGKIAVGAVQQDGSLLDLRIPGAGFLGDQFRP